MVMLPSHKLHCLCMSEHKSKQGEFESEGRKGRGREREKRKGVCMCVCVWGGGIFRVCVGRGERLNKFSSTVSYLPVTWE